MSETPRDKILKRLYSISNYKEELLYPKEEDEDGIFSESTDSLEVIFAGAFSENGGKFIYCESQSEFVSGLKVLISQKNWKKVSCWNTDLQKILDSHNFKYESDKSTVIESEAGITTCEALIARTGSIILSSGSDSGRSLSIVPSAHIVLCTSNQVVYDLKDILNLQTAKGTELPSMISITSTNSQTADIEKTLVNGAHGPKELYVFMLEAR
jgi:L-lactate dehydrogenase complex protein LldG